MLAPAVFAFGLVAFGFLGMGPVTIAVDSYGPVTDNAQSVYELSLIETDPEHQGRRSRRTSASTSNFERGQAPPRGERRRRQHLQGHRQAGAHRHRRRRRHHDDLLDHHGAHRRPHRRTSTSSRCCTRRSCSASSCGGAMIYWFTGASTQAVTTGAYRAVEFIKANIKLEGVDKASVEDSKKVVEICTQYAQKGMFNIFLAVFFAHAGLRLPRAVLLHRLPDLDRALRPVPGHLHGQRRRRLGQRQEDRRGRAEGEGHAAARGRPSSATPSATRSRTPRRWP